MYLGYKTIKTWSMSSRSLKYNNRQMNKPAISIQKNNDHYYGSQEKEEVDQTGVSRNFSKEVKFDL